MIAFLFYLPTYL